MLAPTAMRRGEGGGRIRMHRSCGAWLRRVLFLPRSGAAVPRTQPWPLRSTETLFVPEPGPEPRVVLVRRLGNVRLPQRPQARAGSRLLQHTTIDARLALGGVSRPSLVVYIPRRGALLLGSDVACASTIFLVYPRISTSLKPSAKQRP